MNIPFGLVPVVLGVGACAQGWFIRRRGSTFQAGNGKNASAGMAGEAKSSSTGDDYQRLSLGTRVAIRYLPDAPNNVILREGAGEQTGPTLLTNSIWAFAAGAALIIIGVVLWLR